MPVQASFSSRAFASGSSASILLSVDTVDNGGDGVASVPSSPPLPPSLPSEPLLLVMMHSQVSQYLTVDVVVLIHLLLCVVRHYLSPLEWNRD